MVDKRVDFSYNKLGQFDVIERYASLDTSELVVTTSYAYNYAHRLTELYHNLASNDGSYYEFDYDAANRIEEIGFHGEGEAPALTSTTPSDNS